MEFDYVVDTGLTWPNGRVKRSKTIKIILHHTVGSYGTPKQWLALHNSNIKKGNKGVPYNYLVCQDGTIFLGRGLEYTNGGVKDNITNNANQTSVAVALDGDMRKSDLPTSVQLASAVRLIKDIIKYYKLTPTDAIGHREVPLYSNGKPTGKTYQTLCPCIKEEYGNAPKNMDEFRAMVAGTIEVSVYTSTRRTLSKGMSGVDVKEAQTLLSKLGYGDLVGTIDGDFGTKTDTAVKKLQEEHSLDKTGVIDEVVWKILDGNYTPEDPGLDDDGDEKEEEHTPEVKNTFPKFGKYTGTTYSNIREGNNALKKSIGKINKNDECIILSEKDDWKEIVLLNANPIIRGWCSAKYIEVI